MFDVAGLADAFRRQGEACGALGSPIYEALCGVASEDLVAGGVTAEVFSVWDGSGDPMWLALPLRLLGTAHRLALLGEAPGLARHYPSCGGTPGPDMGADLLALVEDRLPTFRADLGRPVQTNEVGRAAVLRPALGVVSEEWGLPIRLLEIGAAAGLNLRLDHFSYRLGAVALPGRNPHLEPRWTGPDPPPGPVDVVGRAGCDLHPIDVASAEGAARAESFVWPDMTWRFERMAAAVATARRVPAPVEAAGAGEWLEAALHPEPGIATVLMHSVMWQYMPESEQAQAQVIVDARGAAATEEAPLAHLRFELAVDGDGGWGFELRLRTWPGGMDRLLAVAHPHGEWVEWVDH